MSEPTRNDDRPDEGRRVPRIVRIRKALGRRATRLRNGKRPALGDLDRKLERYLNFEGGFFIEAGANDGIAQSNTYYLERTKGWRGLLIEGIPDLADRCRRARPGSVVVQCALVAEDFEFDTVTMRYANLMSLVDGAQKDSQAEKLHIKSGLQIQGIANTYSIDVPARTLQAVLDEQPNLPRIDFLSLDVEGYELSVLRGIGVDRYRPGLILVECRFHEEVDEFLLFHGYELIEKMSHHDYLYRDATFAARIPAG